MRIRLQDPARPGLNFSGLRVAALALALSSSYATAGTMMVGSTSDMVANDGFCTLREAITTLNNGADFSDCVRVGPDPYGTNDTIGFDIVAATDAGCNAGTGVCTIRPGTALPAIIRTVEINGYVQAGASPNTLAGMDYPNAQGLNTQLRIELDGSLAGAAANGIWLQGPGGSRVRGLSIFGFGSAGVRVASSSAVIAGNFIGIRADGTTASGNGFGVYIGGPQGTSAVVGVDSIPLVADRNLISSNLNAAEVSIVSSNANRVAGNLLGTDSSGTLARGTSRGIAIAGSIAGNNNNIVSNVVAGGVGAGVTLSGVQGNNVMYNSIGIAVGGAPLGNSTYGILVLNAGSQSSQNNSIRYNGIAHNGFDGIGLEGDAVLGNPNSNILTDNSIFANSGLGINLRPVGEIGWTPTLNDAAPDADTGPNGLQNFPVIASATVNGTGGIDIAFTLNSAANEDYRLSAYANDACDASGYGEGRYPSGVMSPIFTTNGTGTVSATFTVPSPLPAGWSVGQAVTMLAQNANTLDTSEFSLCATVAAGSGATPPVMGNVPDQSGTTGTAMTIDLSAYVTPTEGDPIISYAYTGTLPGLSFNFATGLISGTPMAPGSYSINVTASDDDGPSNADTINFVIAAAPSDTTPNAFSFTDVSGATTSTLHVSNAIVVSGINAAAPISVTGGEYRINGGGWTNAAGSVNNGASVEVRLASSAAASTTVSATLTIGGVADTFSVQTAATPPAPGAIVAPIPTLSEWGMLIMSLLLATFGIRSGRDRRS